MTGLDEDPVEIRYLGLASWPNVLCLHFSFSVDGSVLIRECGGNEEFGCDIKTDDDGMVNYLTIFIQ